jgi:hypothetical protein
MVWINAPADVVCVKLSTWPSPVDDELEACCMAAFTAIADALGG